MRFDRRSFLAAIGTGASGAALADQMPNETFPALTVKEPHTFSDRINTTGWIDRGLWANYDNCFLRHIEGSARSFFQVPVGAYGPGGYQRTKADTNMCNAGHFSPPRAMLAQRIGFVLSDESLALNFSRSVYEFIIGDKIFAEGPMFFQNGVAYYDIQPKVIHPLVNFQVRLTNIDLGGHILNNSASDLNYSDDARIVCTLVGFADREVM